MSAKTTKIKHTWMKQWNKLKSPLTNFHWNWHLDSAAKSIIMRSMKTNWRTDYGQRAIRKAHLNEYIKS